MKKMIVLLLCVVLCPVWGAALAEEYPTCWINKDLTPYGNTRTDIINTLGEPFWDCDGYDRISAWETDQGTLIAEFSHHHDTPFRWLHIAPDRTILDGTITGDETLQTMRRRLMQASPAQDGENLVFPVSDVGRNLFTPAAITAEGYVITFFLGREWEAYDCVQQKYAGLVTQLRLHFGW